MFSQTILMGRLTSDPKISIQADGKKRAYYNLAVNRDYTKEGQPQADFFGCVTFNGGADFAEKYLKKGTKILVIGRFKTEDYEKDGQKIRTMNLYVTSHYFCEKEASLSNGEIAPDNLSL